MSSFSEKLQAPERADGTAARASLKQLLSRWALRRHLRMGGPDGPEEIRIWGMDPEPEVWVRESKDVYRCEPPTEMRP